MTNSADPDQLASNWSGSTLFAKTGHVVFSKRRVNYYIQCMCFPQPRLIFHNGSRYRDEKSGFTRYSCLIFIFYMIVLCSVYVVRKYHYVKYCHMFRGSHLADTLTWWIYIFSLCIRVRKCILWPTQSIETQISFAPTSSLLALIRVWTRFTDTKKWAFSIMIRKNGKENTDLRKMMA